MTGLKQFVRLISASTKVQRLYGALGKDKTMPFVDLSTGAGLDYIDSGAGEPFIVVHGRLGTAELDLGNVIAWLETDYRVLGPTMRGYGNSTPKPRDFPLDFYHRDAADLLAFMDALHIDRAHIMGYSDGGEIALIAAGTHPDRFHSVTVWGAVGYFGPAIRPFAQQQFPADWLRADPDLMARHGITEADAFILKWIKAIKYMVDSGGDVSLSLADKIACPVLMMLGREDTLNPEEYGRAFITRTAHGRLEMFDCGHGIHDEAWDEFKDIVGAFLAQNR